LNIFENEFISQCDDNMQNEWLYMKGLQNLREVESEIVED
jgi:hypothetical protein